MKNIALRKDLHELDEDRNEANFLQLLEDGSIGDLDGRLNDLDDTKTKYSETSFWFLCLFFTFLLLSFSLFICSDGGGKRRKKITKGRDKKMEVGDDGRRKRSFDL